MKHINDFILQEIAQNNLPYSDYESHLNQCEKCRENLSFYKKMFALLSDKLEDDFSSDFAANIINQVTIIENREKRIKMVLSFFLILLLSIIPFILFPDSLTQFTVFGKGFSKFFGYIRTTLADYNISSWSIFSVILLIIIIQLFEYITKHDLRKR